MVNREPGVGKDAPQSAGPDYLVVGHYGTGVGRVAAQDHVAACLTAEYESSALQGAANVTS